VRIFVKDDEDEVIRHTKLFGRESAIYYMYQVVGKQL